MSAHAISVIIPCRNEEKYIGRCITALLDQDYSHEKMEVLFVDGMSIDRTREIIEGYSGTHKFIRLLANPKKIVPAAMNIGIRQSKGEIIIRMDAHTIYPPDYITRCVEYLDKTGAENVGGAIVSIAETFWGRAIAEGMSSVFGVGNSRFRVGGYEGCVDTVPFGAYRRELFDRIGFFDEELVRNQDDEMNYRVIRNGGRIYMASAIKSYYYPRDSLRKLWRQYYEYGYWKVRVIQKHGMPASWRHIVPGGFVLGNLAVAVLALTDVKYLGWFLLTAGSYLILSLLFSAKIAAEKGVKYLPALPPVFATLHISYGVGFWKGVWDFMLSGKHKNTESQDKGRMRRG